MNKQQAEIAAQLLPAVLPAARQIVVQQMETKQMERQKEMQMEIIEARDEQQGAAMPLPEPDPEPEPEPQEQTYDDAIDDLKLREDCAVCRDILEAMRDVDDPRRQARALAEYGRFKQATSDTRDVEKLKDEIRDFDVLKDVMSQSFNLDVGDS